MHVQFCDTNKVKDVQKKRKSLAELLKDIKIDLIAERYKTDVEKIAFLKYNNINLKLVLIRFKVYFYVSNFFPFSLFFTINMYYL